MTAEFNKKTPPKVKFKRMGADEQMEPVKLAPKPATPKVKKVTLPPLATPHITSQRIVAIPAGNPYLKPAKYGPNLDTPWYKSSNPWPEGFPSNEEIFEWVHKIKQIAEERGEKLLPSAIVFYAMHFWNWQSLEFAEVKELINS